MPSLATAAAQWGSADEALPLIRRLCGLGEDYPIVLLVDEFSRVADFLRPRDGPPMFSEDEIKQCFSDVVAGFVSHFAVFTGVHPQRAKDICHQVGPDTEGSAPASRNASCRPRARRASLRRISGGNAQGVRA